jgi:hypothetical protein
MNLDFSSLDGLLQSHNDESLFPDDMLCFSSSIDVGVHVNNGIGGSSLQVEGERPDKDIQQQAVASSYLTPVMDPGAHCSTDAAVEVDPVEIVSGLAGKVHEFDV